MSEDPEPPRLLIRKRPGPDESFISFLLRLSEANWAESPRWLLKAAGINRAGLCDSYGLIFSESLNLTRLASLADVHVAYLQEMMLPRARFTACKTVRGNTQQRIRGRMFYGHILSNYMVRPQSAKICPDCLRDTGYCRKIWDVTLVTACLEHQCLLFDECPDCGRKIMPLRKKLCICMCGYDWRDIPAKPLDFYDLKVSKHIHQLCGLHAGGDEDCPNPLSGLRLDSFLTILIFIAAQYLGIKDVIGNKLLKRVKGDRLHESIVKAFMTFEEWPKGYFEFLDWKREQGNKASYATGVRKDFGSFHDVLYRELLIDDFNFLRDAFGDYLCRWDGGHVNRVSVRKPDKVRTSYIGITEASKRIGLSLRTLRGLIEEGKITGTVRRRNKKSLILIEPENLERYQREWKSYLRRGDIAEQLGIKPNMVTNLVDSGLLKTIRMPLAKGGRLLLFSEDAANNLMEKIRSRVSKVPPQQTDLVDFLTALKKFSFRGCGIASLITSILEGDVVPCREADGRGLARFQLSRKELSNRFINSQMLGAKTSYSINGIRTMLGVQREAVEKLIEHGFLRSEWATGVQKRMRVVSREALMEFDSTYLCIYAKARELRVTSKILVDLLKAKKIYPAPQTASRVGLPYIYRKADLEHIDFDRLVSSRKRQLTNSDNVQPDMLQKKPLKSINRLLIQVIDNRGRKRLIKEATAIMERKTVSKIGA